MNKIHNYLLFITLSCILIGCGSVGVEERKAVRKFVSQGQFDKAIETIEKGDIKKDAKSQILYFMEMGRLYYGMKDYGYAADWFNKARVLIDEYYTKSISQKVGAKALNENIENYYGEIYEVSMLHYYLAKSYYHIYSTGILSIEKEMPLVKGQKTPTISRVNTELSDSKRKQYLFSARAEILAWDTFYKDLQRSGRSTVFKSDLMIKLFGASIHEAIGTSSDLNIALQLYKDAKKVLYTVSNILESYNKKNKEYSEDRIKNINNLVEFIPSKNFEPTAFQNELKNFIDSKILNLTKRISPNSVANLIKAESINPEVVKNTTAQKKNVSIFVESSMISEKTGKIINIGIEGAMNSVDSPAAKAMIQAVGVPVLSYFAMNTLGLVPKNRAMTYGEFVYARNASELAVRAIAIEFELPMVEKPTPVKPKSIVVLDKAGKVVATKPLVLVAPLGDIARQNLEESAASRLTTKGIRVAIKHIVAITSAYATYKNMNERGQGAFAGTVAAVAYFAAAKGILASEKADTRYWSTLPQNIFQTDFDLPKGDYTVKIENTDPTGKVIQLPLGQMKVVGDFMNVFTYYTPAD